MDSCCAPAGMGRRSEEELRGGKPLADTHDSAAEGGKSTATERMAQPTKRRALVLLGLLEQAETQWKKFRSSPVGEESEVADANQSPG